MSGYGHIAFYTGLAKNMVATTMITALDAELGCHRKQIVNPPVSGIVAHRFEQLGSLVHAAHSIAFDTKLLAKFHCSSIVAGPYRNAVFSPDTIIAKRPETRQKCPPHQALGKRDTIIDKFSDAWYRRNAKCIFILMPSKIPSGKNLDISQRYFAVCCKLLSD